MKKILFAIIFLPVLAVAQTPFKFTLKGQVGKLDTPAKAFLVRMNGQTPIVDSVKIQQGRFTFTGTLQEIVSAYLLVDHKGIGYEKLDRSADVLPIYLEKGIIKVKAKDSVVRATVSGSAINKDNKKLQAATKIPVEQLSK